MIKKLENIYYPFLFCVYVVLAFYAHNIDHVSFFLPLLTILSIVLIGLLSFYLLNLVVKNVQKTGLLLLLFFITFFSYGHVHGLIYNLLLDKFFLHTGKIRAGVEANLNLHFILIAVYLILLGVGFWTIVRKDIKNVTKGLNFITLILILTAVFNIITYKLQSKNKKVSASKVNIYNATEPEIKRDIYYIILDGYGRSDYLQKYYNHNNKPFLDFLRSKGFYVASKSQSNYPWTFLSLPSSLNVNYLDQLDIPQMGTKSKDSRILFEKIKDNHVSKLLKEMGYKYIHFKSTWSGTEKNPFADKHVGLATSFLASNEFIRVFMETTLLKIFTTEINGSLAKSHLHSLEEIKKVPEVKDPTFTFYHVLMPHHPYLFDRDGNVLKDKNKYNQFYDSQWGKGEAYIEQLIFVNKEITKVINTILEKSEIEPIIILQSDHGPKLAGKTKSEFIKVRFGNLNALYFPGKSKNNFHDKMTPVNNFRLLFNEYFNANYPILEDHSYFSEAETPYFVSEVK